MVKSREIDSVTLNPFAWKPTNPVRRLNKVGGLDTETSQDGYAQLLTVSLPQSEHAVRLHGFQDFVSAIHHYQLNRHINFFYNVDFDFSAIAKWMGPKHLANLAAVGLTIWNDFTVSWVQNKAFTITRGNQVEKMENNEGELGTGKIFKFFDAAQFYEKKSLASVAHLVGEKKLDYDTTQIDWKKFDNNKSYRSRLLKYAIRDSVICRKLGLRLHNAVNFLVPLHQYYSTATIAQTYFLSRIPDGMGLPPKEIMNAALLSYGGGRFELVQRGFFPKVWSADINSAYPYQMDRLVAIGPRFGKWRRVKEPDDEAHYGFYLISTNTYDTLLSPVMVHMKGNIVYPHGHHKKWVEKTELDLILKMGFKVKIFDGYEFHTSSPKYPFKCISQQLYPDRLKHKQEGRDDLQYTEKITMNSGYGKTIQLTPHLEFLSELPQNFVSDGKEKIVKEIEHENGKVSFAVRNGWNSGKMFNPIYGAAITARNRSFLLHSVVKHRLEKNLIGMATDSIVLDTRPPETMLGNGLGQWKLEVDSSQKNHQGLFIGSGVYAIRNAKEIFDPITKTKKKIDVNHFRGFVTKHNLFDYISKGFIVTQEDGEERRGIRFDMVAPVKLKEGVRGGVRTTPTGEEQITWKDIAVFKPVRKILDLNFDKKRKWERLVSSPQELLSGKITSEALVI